MDGSIFSDGMCEFCEMKPITGAPGIRREVTK